MKIENSLDWNNVWAQLRSQMDSVGYTPDFEKMLTNIASMVDDLSKLEVEARRTRNTNMTQEKVKKINQSIDHLEKLVLMALLMQ